MRETGGELTLPALIAWARQGAAWPFREFITVNIRNANQRAAYARAAADFSNGVRHVQGGSARRSLVQWSNLCDTLWLIMTLRFDKATRDRVLRLILRTVPVVPGPELFDLVIGIKRSQTDFDKQVAEAVEGLGKTSTLISSLQQGVEERMAKLQRLREEHERYSELAQIEASKAAALLKQVEMTLGKEQKKERWIALSMHLGVGFLFFVLGVLLAEPFKGWVTSIWGKLR